MDFVLVESRVGKVYKTREQPYQQPLPPFTITRFRTQHHLTLILHTCLDVVKAAKVSARVVLSVIARFFATTSRVLRSLPSVCTPHSRVHPVFTDWVTFLGRLARRGGVKRISGLIYEETRGVLKVGNVASACASYLIQPSDLP